MNTAELILMAARAVVGPTQGEVIARVADALEHVQNRADATGYAEGYRDAMKAFKGDEQPEVYNCAGTLRPLTWAADAPHHPARGWGPISASSLRRD